MITIRISAPHFTAGLETIVTEKRVVVFLAAPIVSYMRGWLMEEVMDYCKRKKWLCEIIQDAAVERQGVKDAGRI